MANQPSTEAVNMDESNQRPDIANPQRLEFSAAERYPGEWVVPKALGRAHLVLSKNGKVHTACGHRIAESFPAAGRAWDGCETCVGFAIAQQTEGARTAVPGTLNAWLDEWLAQMTLARPRTVLFYRQKLAHIRPRLGDAQLAELQPRDIRLALGAMAGDGMTPTMLSHIHRTLSTALYAAKRERLIVGNPGADVARPSRADFEARTLTVEQARRLVELCWGAKLGPLVIVALSTGMRSGELLALTWDDIDLVAGEITVNKTVNWARQAGEEHRPGRPKTRSARRTVRIEGPPVAALTEQRERCHAMRLVASEWVEHNLVFPAMEGGYMAPTGRFMQHYHALLSQAGCPRIRFHDLRHTAGLFLTRSVGVVVASRILGHASPTITMSLYGHAQQQDYAAASHAMSGMLGGSIARAEFQTLGKT